MFMERLITSLVSVALKNPRAAATAVLILVVGFLGYTVKFLFIRSDRKDIAVYENLVTENRNLEKNVATLRYERDSLMNRISVVETNGLRREIAIKDSAIRDLRAFRNELNSKKHGVAQNLNVVQKSANKNRIASEKLNKPAHETD